MSWIHELLTRLTAQFPPGGKRHHHAMVDGDVLSISIWHTHEGKTTCYSFGIDVKTEGHKTVEQVFNELCDLMVITPKT